MDFAPHNSKHAVQSTSFAVFFEKLSRVPGREDFSERSQVLASLPGTRPFNAILLAIGDGKAQQSTSSVGVELYLAEPDGSPAWLLRLAPDHFAVECQVYTRWKHVWETAFDYFSESISAAEKIADQKLKLERVEMRVTDRFVTPSPSYDLSSLLRKSSYLPTFAFGAGPAWHAHTGWYANKPRTLNNLNVDTKPVVDKKSDGSWQLQILHFQRMELKDERGDPVFEGLPSAFDHLHRENKRMISELLTEQIGKTVGLIRGSE